MTNENTILTTHLVIGMGILPKPGVSAEHSFSGIGEAMCKLVNGVEGARGVMYKVEFRYDLGRELYFLSFISKMPRNSLLRMIEFFKRSMKSPNNTTGVLDKVLAKTMYYSSVCLWEKEWVALPEEDEIYKDVMI